MSRVLLEALDKPTTSPAYMLANCIKLSKKKDENRVLEDFAKKSGISTPVVYNLLTEKTKRPSKKTIIKLSIATKNIISENTFFK